MDLRQLRYFMAVCRTGSVAAASRALHIAQPALSRQMAALEDELGAALFVRLPRGMALTRAGEALRLHAGQAIADVEAIREQVALAAAGKAGSLRIGVMPGFSWLPGLGRAISALSRHASKASVHVESGLSGSLVEAVKRRELDAAVVGWRSPLDAATTAIPIFSDRMALAMPRVLAERLGKVRRLRELAGQEFILFPRASSPSYYDALVRILREAGISIGSLGTEATDSPTIVGLVSAGLGCSIVPLSYRIHCPANVVLQEVEGLDFAFDLELVWRSEATDPLLQAFVEGWQAEGP